MLGKSGRRHWHNILGKILESDVNFPAKHEFFNRCH